MTKAIILLSGGLDSTVMLAMALSQAKTCLAVSYDYQQKNRFELEAAHQVVSYYSIPWHTITLDPVAFMCSSLVGNPQPPLNRTATDRQQQGIPNTFVPARNTIFLSYALALAEYHNAQEIHLGATAMDTNCYPDCRPAYIQAFQGLLNVANQRAIENHPIKLHAPLLYLNKTEIIRKGLELKAPLQLTLSCYQPKSLHETCEECDACIIRKEGFQAI